jgi:putative hydrolase of the HAD superfamily
MMKKNYKHLFFDLDGTLWDFARNSEETLSDLFYEYQLGNGNELDFEAFHQAYIQINNGLWDEYRQGKLAKEVLSVQRFSLTLAKFGIAVPGLAEEFSVAYVNRSPTKTKLLPFALETLAQLSTTYQLHLITNGFIEVQETKISLSKIRDYIQHMITSEEVGCLKPCKAIFEYAFEKTGAEASESLMIGDDYAIDIVGGSTAGMDTVFYNPLQHPSGIEATYTIDCLSQLANILTSPRP